MQNNFGLNFSVALRRVFHVLCLMVLLIQPLAAKMSYSDMLMTISETFASDTCNRPAEPLPPAGYKVTTLADSLSGVNAPFSSVIDSLGNIFYAQQIYNPNDTIYKVTPEGVVSVFANLGNTFDMIGSITIDHLGNIYASHKDTTILKITPAGDISTYAHDPSIWAGSGMTFDSGGNLYSVDSQHGYITKISPDGVVSSHYFNSGYFGMNFDRAGNLYLASPFDDKITKITPNDTIYSFVSGIGGPIGLTFDSAGYLYSSNMSGTISRISPSGAVTTIVSGLPTPVSLNFDKKGNLFTANFYDNSISKIALEADSTSVCPNSFSVALSASTFGNNEVIDWYDAPTGGNKLASDTATFYTPALVTAKTYYAESRNTLSGCVSLKRTAYKVLIDTTCTENIQASNLVFTHVKPTQFTASWAPGNISKREVFVKQANSGTIIPVKSKNYLDDPVFGNGDQIGSSGWFCVYNGSDSIVTVKGLNPLTDYIVQVFESNGHGLLNVSIASDNPRTVTTTCDAPAAPIPPSGLKVKDISVFASPNVDKPTSIAFDSQDNIYFSASADSIYKITPQGVTTPFIYVSTPTGITLDNEGNGYVGSSSYSAVFKMTPAGVFSTYAYQVDSPTDLVFDASGNLLVGNSYTGQTNSISPAGVVTHYTNSFGSGTYGMAIDKAGNLYAAVTYWDYIGKMSAPNTLPQVYVSGTGFPGGLTFDKFGNLYASNNLSGTISKISPAGVATTIASGFDQPSGIKFDSKGNLFVASMGDNSFKKITFGTDSVAVCKGSTATLKAITAESDQVVDWYDAPSGGSLLATDTSFVTPAIDTTTIFYAESRIPASGCVSATRTAYKVVVNAAPALFKVTGGGKYPTGGTGVAVGLDGSQTGVTYQLKVAGRDTLSAITGTGSLLTFGLQTTVGKYTVVATNETTGCTAKMADSAMVAKGPTLFHVTGGGRYCTGGSGVTICLSGSDPGMKYELRSNIVRNDKNLIDSRPTMTGNGSSICFGPITEAATYKIYAKEGPPYVYTQMLDSVVVAVNPLPTAYNVTGGGTYCTGGSGVAVGLSNSKAGITYQLKQGGTDTGLPVKGTGSAISFGLQTVAATYTVLAVDTTTFCQKTMTGSVTVKVSTPPNVAAIAGGAASVCINSKTPAFTDATKSGIWSIVPVTGTASITSGGVVTGLTAGTVNVTYTVTSGCSASVTKSLTINDIPAAPAAITGTKTVCAGSTTALADATAGGVWSSSSTSVATVSGTGVVTGVAAGNTTISYTVSNGSGCTNITTTTVTVNPRAAQPSAFTKSSASVTQGQSNVIYTVTNVSGMTYSWSYSGTGATITGTSNSVTISFSKTATAGVLSVTATNGCGTSTARTLSITMKKYGTKSIDVIDAEAALNPEVTVPVDEFAVYPNPTSGPATFNFQIAENGRVKITIYSITGQLIARIFDADVEAGQPQNVQLEQYLPSGIYPCILQYNGKILSLKLAVRH